MQFEALGDNVLIRPFQKEQTEGGVYLPEGSAHPNDLLKGEIVSIGPGAYSMLGEFVPTTLSVGDIVYLSFRGAPSPVTIDGEKYIICRESEINGAQRRANREPKENGNGKA